MDVEGFCGGMAESISVPAETMAGPGELSEIQQNVAETLEFLDTWGVKGTFFVLGRVADLLPDMVRMIAQEGHEIASHSFEHLRLYNMSHEQIHDTLTRSRKVLEDVSGTHVKGFRAPDFSINDQTLHILDMIQEAGYRYDSSLYPIQGHDVYGVRDTEPWIYRLPNGLVEYPLSTVEVAGWRIPALGGGYFRLYPLTVTRRILRRIERGGHSAMFYIHPYELGTICPLVSNLSWPRRLRHYVNRGKTKKRFCKLFVDHQFGRVEDVLQSRGFL